MPISPNSVSEEILAALAPMLYNESGSSGPLAIYITGLGQMFQLIETYASDDPDTDAIGYSLWVDLDRAPEEVLPWLAQFVGVQLPIGVVTTEQFVATNMILNPSGEIDTYSIFPLTGDPIFSAPEESFFGQRSFKITSTSATNQGIWFQNGVTNTDNFVVQPSKKHSLGCMVKPSTATELVGVSTLTLGINWYRSDGVFISNSTQFVSIPSNVWTAVSFNGVTSPANAAQAVVLIQSVPNIAAGHQFYIDGVIFTQSDSSYIGSYFDGSVSVDMTKTGRWKGTPHRSASDLFTIPSINLKKIKLINRSNWGRGTPAAMVAAAQEELIGAKRVVLRERFTGDAYLINVVTFTNETPDAAKVLAKLLSQKPAGIVLTHNVVLGQDYQLLLDNNASYSAVLTKYATYSGVLTDTPGA